MKIKFGNFEIDIDAETLLLLSSLIGVVSLAVLGIVSVLTNSK